MTLASAQPTPPWADDITTVTAAQLALMDNNITNAADAAGGGSYSTAARLNIDGAGIGSDDALLDGVVSLTGSLTMSGSAARLNYRVDVGTLIDAAGDITCAKDLWIVTVVVATPRVYTIRHTGTVPEVGTTVRLKREGLGGANITVYREDTVTLLATIPSSVESVLFCYAAADGWRAIDWTTNVTAAL